MKKHISLDKRSKKAQKEYYSGLRQTWNGLNPVTRTVPNGKAYNRSRAKREQRDDCSLFSCRQSEHTKSCKLACV